jgi:hypothetical protein
LTRALTRGLVREDLVLGNLGNESLLLALNVLNEGDVSFDRFAVNVHLNRVGWFPDALNDAAHCIALLVRDIDLLADSDLHADELPAFGFAKQRADRSIGMFVARWFVRRHGPPAGNPLTVRQSCPRIPCETPASST